SEEHTSELQSLAYLVCRLLLEKKKAGTQSSARVASATSALYLPRALSILWHPVLFRRQWCSASCSSSSPLFLLSRQPRRRTVSAQPCGAVACDGGSDGAASPAPSTTSGAAPSDSKARFPITSSHVCSIRRRVSFAVLHWFFFF